MIRELRERYGNQFEEPLLEEIAEVGVLRQVAAGDKLLEIGEYITVSYTHLTLPTIYSV